MKEAEIANPTPEMMRACDALHLIMCKEDHDGSECLYMMEEQLDNCWSRTYHRRWAYILLTLIAELKCSISSMESIIGRLNKIIADNLQLDLTRFFIFYILSDDKNVNRLIRISNQAIEKAKVDFPPGDAEDTLTAAVLSQPLPEEPPVVEASGTTPPSEQSKGTPYSLYHSKPASTSKL